MPVAEIRKLNHKKIFSDGKRKESMGRWGIAEAAFSSVKSIYGECISATRFQNMVKEMAPKVSLYSLLGRLS